ncbi:MAG TPA: hypothetical protein VMY35_00330 [Phycisphaerae bacterium]|nr:hypothetical protein [Phycisphaerae bacterium]
MPDSTLDSELFYLLDTTPGVPNPTLTTPVGGFTAEACHNVVAPAYPVGTKIQVYNETAGVAGYSTFVYAQAETQDATNVIKARMFLTTLAATPVWWKLTNDAGADIGDGINCLVVALSTMTTAYYGWFWCEGVCPEDYVAALGGNYYTEGDVAIGPVTGGTLATPGTTAGEIGLTAVAADTSLVVGISLALDAA